MLGTGTSMGVPSIGCDCAVCRSTWCENKRLRTSAYVEHAGGKFLIDCSTDFRTQALAHNIRQVDAVLITHDHADHVNGIDDLRAVNFVQRRPIDIYARADVVRTLDARYAYCFNPPQRGGGVPQIRLHEIEEGRPFDLNGLPVLPIGVKHGRLDILGFRLGGAFGYLTDCSAVPQPSAKLLAGLDALVLDALRPRPHSTHFGLAQAVAFADRIGVSQAWFTHMTCQLEHHTTNASLPPNRQLLYDGQILEADERPLPDLA